MVTTTDLPVADRSPSAASWASASTPARPTTGDLRTRRLIDVETHRAVFTWVQERLVGAGPLKGRTVAIDATTLEANRRDAQHHSARHRRELPGLSHATRACIGDQDADARSVGAAPSTAEEADLEQGFESPRIPTVLKKHDTLRDYLTTETIPRA